MGRKKQPAKRKSKNQEIKKLDTTFILMVFLTILLMIIVYGKSGGLAKTLDPILRRNIWSN